MSSQNVQSVHQDVEHPVHGTSDVADPSEQERQWADADTVPNTPEAANESEEDYSEVVRGPHVRTEESVEIDTASVAAVRGGESDEEQAARVRGPQAKTDESAAIDAEVEAAVRGATRSRSRKSNSERQKDRREAKKTSKKM